MSSSNPGPLDMWLLKWIVSPIIAILLIRIIWCFSDFKVMEYKCQRMAEERGYIEATYIPPNRLGFGEECICKMKRNPDGTIDENARLVINLDVWRQKRKNSRTSDCPPTASHKPAAR
jgi:hypothetical protein